MFLLQLFLRFHELPARAETDCARGGNQELLITIPNLANSPVPGGSGVAGFTGAVVGADGSTGAMVGVTGSTGAAVGVKGPTGAVVGIDAAPFRNGQRHKTRSKGN